MRSPLTDAAAAFTAQLGRRHPDWLPFLSGSPETESDLSGVRLEVPSPGGGPLLWIELRDGGATVGLGEKGAELAFVWKDPAERDDAFASIFQFLSDVRSAKVVLGWRRHRFLWKRWETPSFVRTIDIPRTPAIARVEAWPAPDPDAS